MINKKIITATLLISIFAIGTLSITDTVEAATWKIYDSGSFNAKYPEAGYKKKMSYVTYIKGSKDMKMKMYGYKIKNNKKTYLATVYINKIGNKIKTYSTDEKGKKSKPEYGLYKSGVKTFYKNLIYVMENS